MYIKKVKIHNFKCYKDFEIILDEGLNIIVGDNEAGKSTILEAINLALTGLINGKSIWNEISQYIFNNDSVDEYINSLNAAALPLPSIAIEIYFGGDENPTMNGDGNSDRDKNAEGFCFKIAFNEDYAEEYEILLNQDNIKSLPIEYYDVTWTTFARDVITTRSIPYKSSLIDSSEYKYQSGNDLYLSRIIKASLEPNDLISVSQAHRKMRDLFMDDQSIQSINNKINQDASLTNKRLALSVELVTKNAWENSLVTQLDDIPFYYVGKGEQCIIKTELALAKKSSNFENIILLEEPENHLSHSKLNQLINVFLNNILESRYLLQLIVVLLRINWD